MTTVFESPLPSGPCRKRSFVQFLPILPIFFAVTYLVYEGRILKFLGFLFRTQRAFLLFWKQGYLVLELLLLLSACRRNPTFSCQWLNLASAHNFFLSLRFKLMMVAGFFLATVVSLNSGRRKLVTKQPRWTARNFSVGRFALTGPIKANVIVRQEISAVLKSPVLAKLSRILGHLKDCCIILKLITLFISYLSPTAYGTSSLLGKKNWEE